MFRATLRNLAIFSLLFGLVAIIANVAVAQTVGRHKVIMSLVLDRSGSMTSDGGEAALQSAVPNFVVQFNNIYDEVGLVSFADNGEIDVPIGYNFIAPITSAVENMPFGGGTFGTGAGNQPILSPTVGAPM